MGIDNNKFIGWLYIMEYKGIVHSLGSIFPGIPVTAIQYIVLLLGSIMPRMTNFKKNVSKDWMFGYEQSVVSSLQTSQPWNFRNRDDWWKYPIFFKNRDIPKFPIQYITTGRFLQKYRHLIKLSPFLPFSVVKMGTVPIKIGPFPKYKFIMTMINLCFRMV